MRNKKGLISLFVIVALLCLGIGYAAISKQLSVVGEVSTGSTTNLEENYNVYFSNKSVVSQSSDITSADITIAADKLSANFLVSGMTKDNSEVVFTLTVKNDSDLFATSTGYEIYFLSPYDSSTSTFTELNKIVTGENFTSVSSGASESKTYNSNDALYGRGHTFEITISQEGAVYNQIQPQGTSVITITIKMITPPLEQTTYGFKIDFNFQAAQYGSTS